MSTYSALAIPDAETIDAIDSDILELQGMLTRRVQVPNIQGSWFQKQLQVLLLGPETSNIVYLDPLGYAAPI